MIPPIPAAAFVEADRTVSISALRFLQQVRQMASPPQVRTLQTVGASPWTYPDVAADWPQVVLVQGGTVSQVEYSGDGATFDDAGVVAGMFALPAQARLRVTWAVVPTVTTWTTGASR